MARELTKKERGFIADYAKTGNGTRAVLNNYDTTSENVAGNIASENLRKPKIINAIKSIADSIPDELLIERHLDLLNSQGQFGIDVQGVSKGLDMAYKIKGIYAPEEKNVTMKVENLEKIMNTTKNILTDGSN